MWMARSGRRADMLQGVDDLEKSHAKLETDVDSRNCRVQATTEIMPAMEFRDGHTHPIPDVAEYEMTDCPWRR